MNDLELVTSKICSAREIIDNAIDKIQEHQNDKAELLMNAAYEFLEYYLQEFDDKFKLAWQATVGDLRNGDREAYNAAMRERDYYENVMPSATQRDIENFQKLQNTILWPPKKEKSDKPNLTCDKDDPSPECKGAWDSFWEETYYPEEHKGSTVSSVQYTEEELNAMCNKAASDEEKEKCREYNLREAEYYNKRAELDAEHEKSKYYYDFGRNKTYDQMIAEGWEMTDDGFWIKEN